MPGDLVHATSLAIPPVGARPSSSSRSTTSSSSASRSTLTRRGVAFHRRGLELTRRGGAVVIVPTAFGRDDLAREGFDPARIHVAHHGVRLPVPSVDPDRLLRALGVTVPYVLFVGTIEPRKGVADALEAHRRLRARHPDLGLVLVGPRGWGETPSTNGPGVHELGSVTDEAALDALYRHALALAHPARYEGFGLPPVEAMAAKHAPMVVSDAACLPEVVRGKAGSWSPPAATSTR